MVKVHEALGQVPVRGQRDQVEGGQRHERVEEDLGVPQDVQRAVAQEGDVDVVAERNQPQGVAEQGSEEDLPGDDQVVEEELDKVEDDEEREEGVEMDVEGKPPLNIRLAAPEREETLYCYLILKKNNI